MGNLHQVILKLVDSSAGTTDEVPTGLSQCLGWSLCHKASGVESNVGVVNETAPLSGGTLSVILNASDEAVLIVWGRG